MENNQVGWLKDPKLELKRAHRAVAFRTERWLESTGLLGDLSGSGDRPRTGPYVRAVKGPQFITPALSGWIAVVGSQIICFQARTPGRNGYSENLSSKRRDELFNSEIFLTLDEILIEAGWRYYNSVSPRRGLASRASCGPRGFPPSRRGSLVPSATPSSNRRQRSLFCQ
jgi:hypothetical protein